MELVRLALNNVIILTADGYHTRQLAPSMGSTLSPLLANARLTQFDIRLQTMKCKLFYRYVDDTIMTIPEDVIEETFSSIKEWCKNLEFTYGAENETGEIYFVHFAIIRNKDHRIESKWLRKLTNNGIALDFFAIAPNTNNDLLLEFLCTAYMLHAARGIFS